MVDAHDSKSCSFGSGSSILPSGTRIKDIMKPIFIIGGPTASNKTKISIRLAKLFDDEIISADSRQVYKGLNEISGKIKKEEMNNIKHHMLDIASPINTTYTAFDYEDQAKKIINKIHSKHKMPIIVGGSGFYIDQLIYKNNLPNVKINQKLRNKLEKLNLKELEAKIKSYKDINISKVDIKNKRRIIRAIEIIETLGYFPNIKKEKEYDYLYIYLYKDTKWLKKQIGQRLKERFENIIKETEKLYKQGMTFEKMDNLGLEIKYASKILKGEDKNKVFNDLLLEIIKYSKRQLTWFRKKAHIMISPLNYKEIEKQFISFRNNRLK